MSFEEWYRNTYRRLVAALVLVADDEELARDAADEAMVRAFERWHRVQAMQSPAEWAYTVGQNLLRRRGRRAAVERTLRRPIEVAGPPELPHEVWEAVRALPQRQRQAIGLRYVLDLSEAQVAEHMDISLGTASATLSAARKKLATHLAKSEPPARKDR